MSLHLTDEPLSNLHPLRDNCDNTHVKPRLKRLLTKLHFDLHVLVELNVI